MMISAEYGAARMYAQGKSFWAIVLLIYVSDTINLILDLFIINRLLAWQWSRKIVETFNQWAKGFIEEAAGAGG